MYLIYSPTHKERTEADSAKLLPTAIARQIELQIYRNQGMTKCLVICYESRFALRMRKAS